MRVQEIKKVRWGIPMKRESSVFLGAIYHKGFDYKYFKKLGASEFRLKHYLSFSNAQLYKDEEEHEANLQKMRDIGDKLGIFAKQITEKFMKRTEEYLTVVDKIKTINFEDASPKIVKDIWNRYIEAYYSLIPYAIIISIYLETVAQEQIIDEIKGQVGSPSEVYSLLSSPKKINRLTEESIGRLRIADVMKDNPEKASKDIKKHIEKYGWLNCFFPTDEPWGFDEILESVNQIAKNKDPKKELKGFFRKRKEIQKKVTKILKKINLSNNARILIDVMSENAWVRTYRKEVMFLGNFYARNLLSRITKDMGIDYEKIAYLASWEISDFLNDGKKISKKDIDKRKRGFVIVRYNNDNFILTGKEVEEINPEVKIDKNITEIRGLTIFAGKVRGKAQIIKGREEMSRFKRGSILVVSNVSTFMTPLVEKCAAIVADEGGVLSHTAVVSREFSKPCVAGTKIATKVFKTGDTLEVDANEGIVRRVK